LVVCLTACTRSGRANNAVACGAYMFMGERAAGHTAATVAFVFCAIVMMQSSCKARCIPRTQLAMLPVPCRMRMSGVTGPKLGTLCCTLSCAGEH
jgi:hypothetical protein